MSNISIEKKWVIFDTCTISNIVRSGIEIEILEPILEVIGKFTPVITPLVRFEFLRLSRTKKEFEEFKTYLDKNFVEIKLSSDSDKVDIYNLSTELACVCALSNKGHCKNITMTDLMHGGMLRRYPLNLYIITFDKNDFPEPIFDTIAHKSINIKGSIDVWVLKKFNKDKFKRYYETAFNKK